MERDALSIDEIKKEIEIQIHHSYLEKFIDQPIIDEDKLFLLTSIFQGSLYPVKQQKSLIVTAMLVQIALDTHDRVSLNDSPAEPEKAKRKRQLTVLAGDYYSGLYYYLLSKLEDIQMIRILASAIKEINEAKMAVYYKEFSSQEEFMEELQRIESLLVRRVAEHFEKEPISTFAQDWLLRKKLIEEKETFLKHEHSAFFQLITKGPALVLNKIDAMTMVENFIESTTERTETRISKFTDQFLMIREYAENRLDSFFRTNNTVIKEG